MSLFSRLLGRSRPRDALVPLYRAIVAEARRPFWYAQGGVPDTIDGRFDMVATILSLVLLRLEPEGEAARADSALLTEVFVEDMDGQLRQSGFGDMIVGKHVGQMMGALGGRLTGYRAALAPDGDLPAAIGRNLYRGAPVAPAAAEATAAGLRAVAADLARLPLATLIEGRIRA